MSYFPIGHRVTGGEIDDFDHCDPTHYSGGYDIDLTYGRSLPPSFETCYPYRSSLSDHPQFASYPNPSAYAVEALGNQHNSFHGHSASAGGGFYSEPKPNYGFQPGGGVFEHGGRDYGVPEPGYGSGYGIKPPSSKFGSSLGRSSEYENPSLMHDKPGRKPDYGESGYGSGVWKPASGFGGSRYESGGSGYCGWPEKPTYPKPSYPDPKYPKPSYPEPSYPIPSYPEPSYPIPSYPEPSYPIPSYPEPSYPIPRYPEPSYPTPGYGLQKHEHDNSDHERRKHHQSHHHGRR